jgi:hypothetical protein
MLSSLSWHRTLSEFEIRSEDKCVKTSINRNAGVLGFSGVAMGNHSTTTLPKDFGDIWPFGLFW